MSAVARARQAANYELDCELFPTALETQVSNGELLDDDEVEQPVVDVINQAAGYARAGLRVFPVLRSADKSLDKKPPPGFRWKDRSSDRVSDVVQEFTAAVLVHGEDFIAVAWALGLDGYCAVDDDTGLPAELDELLSVPHAVNVTKRGCHRIYRQPAGMTPGNSTRGFPVEGWGEFRGVGGYIVITGADRPGLDLAELVDVAEFPRPDWLRDAGESVTAADSRTVVEFLNKHVGNTWPKALDVVTGKLNTETGSRHESLKHALPWAMRDARAGFYPATVAIDQLRGWWRKTMDDPARREGPEFSGLLAWAIGCAQTETDDAIAQRAAKADRRPPPGVDQDTGEILGELDVPVSWSDAHVGEAFGATLTGRWLYCRALGGWQQWDSRRWRIDPGEAVFEEFRQWIIAIGEQLWRSDGDAETMKKVARYRERGKIDAAVTITRRLTTIAARPDEFDTHPHLLNVHNGVVDLRTGDLGPHDPTLKIRQLAGAVYRPDATHPDIDTVLDVMTSGVRNWVQRLLGSATVGTVVDDIVAVADGKGSNGKTTLLKMAAIALGDYATPASTRLLISRATHDEHPTLIADLFGRRLVYIEETPEGGALKMEQLKALSGGTEIKARFIAKDQFTFTPTHQFIVATNHRPAVNASDYAAWRRLRLIPFPNTYRKPHEARPGDLIADLGLRGRLTRQPQREAALTWIIAGAVAWHRHGLGACAEVDQATDAWRRAEDVIEAWWADCIIIDHTGDTGAADLYRSFTNWCTLNGRRPPSNKEFVKKFTDHELYDRHGIDRHDGRTGRIYRGVRSRPEVFR